jgi:hypothetical protein
MTNWIVNRICARGETADLKRFVKAIRGKNQPVDFGRIYPAPNRVNHEEGDVCCKNPEWGTGAPHSIELYASHIVFGFVVIQFETPWLPPGPDLLTRFSDLFPDISFMFHAHDYDAHAEEIIHDGRDIDELERSWTYGVRLATGACSRPR